MLLCLVWNNKRVVIHELVTADLKFLKSSKWSLLDDNVYVLFPKEAFVAPALNNWICVLDVLTASGTGELLLYQIPLEAYKWA